MLYIIFNKLFALIMLHSRLYIQSQYRSPTTIINGEGFNQIIMDIKVQH